MMDWFKNSLIYVTLHGSQAYKLNTELSDLDIKGICIPS
jgi:predicted nucleotidyltransferase